MENTIEKQVGEKLIYVVMVTLALSAMSVLMFNLVLPQIREQFSVTNAQVSWVTSAYTLIYGIGTVIYGKLADRYRLKNLLTIGLIIFATGSLIGFLAQSFWMVLAGRCIQAIGAASIPASAMLIPLRYFPPERRGAAMGTAFIGLSIGSALGPVLSAFVLSILDWRWLFCFPFLLLFTLPFYRRYLQDEVQQPEGSMDWIGGVLLGTAVTLLLLTVTYGTLWYVVGGVIILTMFIVRICSVRYPFIAPRLFRNRSYTLGIIIAFLFSGIGFSLHFLSPLFLAHVNGLPASWIGYALVPGAVASAILGRKGGKIADAKGNVYLFTTATGLLICCYALLSTFIGYSAMYIAMILIFGHVGQTFGMVALSNSVSQTLSTEQSGVGMGFLSMMNFIGGAVATGIYGRLVDIGQVKVWNPLAFYETGAIHSNIFLILTIAIAIISWIYQRYLGRNIR